MDTPFFGLNLSAVKNNIIEVRKYLRSNDRLLYSMKALSHPRLLGDIKDVVDGFDISNPQDLLSLKSLDSFDGYLSACGPLAHLVESDCDVSYLDRTQLNSTLANSERVAIRIDPAFFLNKGSKKVVFSRFGLRPKDLKNYFRTSQIRTKVWAIHIQGVQPQYVNPNSITKILYFLRDECKVDPQRIQQINLGGGWNLGKLKWIKPLSHKLSKESLFRGSFHLEPGRFLLDGSILFFSRIISVVQEDSRKWQVVLDASPDAHLKWSQPQLLTINGKLTSARGSLSSVNFVGATALDADQIPIKLRGRVSLKAGDLLCFDHINSYSYCWTSGFNGMRPPNIEFYTD